MPGSPANIEMPRERGEDSGMIKKGKEMFTIPATLEMFEDLLKAKRTIKTNITNRIRIGEQDLAESSAERPERLATAAKTYY